tara:strand:- start:237 stop:1211 length:975 start_codon:yes stop_codon:yes gene_type:complete
MHNKKSHVYALVHDVWTEDSKHNGPDDAQFYIGVSQDPDQRLNQHQSAVRLGKDITNKYSFIRNELEPNKTDWGLLELQTIPADEDASDWENLYIIEAIRKGYKLQNMRFSGYWSAKGTQILAMDPDIQTIDDVRRVKRLHAEWGITFDSEEAEEKALRKQRRLIKKHLKFISFEDKDGEKGAEYRISDEIRWFPQQGKDEIVDDLSPLRAKLNLHKQRESLSNLISLVSTEVREINGEEVTGGIFANELDERMHNSRRKLMPNTQFDTPYTPEWHQSPNISEYIDHQLADLKSTCKDTEELYRTILAEEARIKSRKLQLSNPA